MNRRLTVFAVVCLLAAVPLSASQFIKLPFDQVAREAAFVVRGTLGPVTSAWDADHQVIYSTAVLTVDRYIDGFGPKTLMVREVGGTVGNFTQEAIGFPMLREGEQVVFFLSEWDDNSDYRIHAYNQGKFLVRNLRGIESLVPDPVQQGDARPGQKHRTQIESVEDALTIDEFTSMVKAARTGLTAGPKNR